MLAVGAYVFPPFDDIVGLKLTVLWIAVALHDRLRHRHRPPRLAGVRE